VAHRSRPVAAIADDLRRLGVRLGDLLMVHASLRKVGPVEGRADGVIDALEAAVGPEGTLLMTLGAHDDWAWVNERPEPERPALLADAVPFDGAVTPAEADIGVLAEVFRRRAGTVVSDHPEGRFGARGRLARVLVEDVPWDDYYGPGSPLERFVAHGGRVLRLGADLGTVTLYHHAEYLVALPAKRRVVRHRRVATPEGSELRVVRCLDDCDGIVDWPGDDYFEDVLLAYLATGRARTGRVGGAASELLDGGDALDHAVGWMAEHLAPHATPVAG
jgi:aminoglycoside N3'-acetyltransferase